MVIKAANTIGTMIFPCLQHVIGEHSFQQMHQKQGTNNTDWYDTKVQFQSMTSRGKKTEGLSSVISLPSLGPHRQMYAILCKQQGACISHNISHTHLNPNRITAKIELNVEL